MQFEVRGRDGAYSVNKKGDKEHRKLKTFQTTKEAFAFIKDDYDALVSEWDGVKERDGDVDAAIGLGPEGADAEAHGVVERTPEERVAFKRIEGPGNRVGDGIAEIDGVVVGVFAEVAAEEEGGGQDGENGEQPRGQEWAAVGAEILEQASGARGRECGVGHAA